MISDFSSTDLGFVSLYSVIFPLVQSVTDVLRFSKELLLSRGKKIFFSILSDDFFPFERIFSKYFWFLFVQLGKKKKICFFFFFGKCKKFFIKNVTCWATGCSGIVNGATGFRLSDNGSNPSDKDKTAIYPTLDRFPQSKMLAQTIFNISQLRTLFVTFLMYSLLESNLGRWDKFIADKRFRCRMQRNKCNRERVWIRGRKI